ncbi:MAG: UDP-glucose dehydrogenase family protein [Candidatus Binatia bacterium]
MMTQRVSVVGLGKLGACKAACMASEGMDVIGVDANSKTVELLNQGRAPVFEAGLVELIRVNRSRLRATCDYRTAVLGSDVTFIVVPTPSDEKGGFSLRYVIQAAREIGRILAEKSDYHIVVLTSTVLPGSTQLGVLPILEQKSGKKCGRDFGMCYNPEFVALGSVIHDLLNPDFILIGESDERAGKTLEALYKSFCHNRPPLSRMNFVNAELTKISINTYVTTKITFANMLANICEELPDADIDTVSAALGLDSRIGRRYLTGALGYGGPCFPRDNQALAYMAQELGCPAGLAESTDRMNRSLPARQSERIRKLLRPDMTVAVLGLAYKPDTNVIEESQGLALVQSLLGNGNRVIVFDPLAMDSARRVLSDEVEYAQSVQECLERSHAIVITNPCKEFRALEAEDFPRRRNPIIVFDCWRIVREKLQNCKWINYIPLGVGNHESSLALHLSRMWQEAEVSQ